MNDITASEARKLNKEDNEYDPQWEAIVELIKQRASSGHQHVTISKYSFSRKHVTKLRDLGYSIPVENPQHYLTVIWGEP